MNAQAIILVFAGAGTGGVVRYLFNTWFNPLLSAMPLGTLAANVLGCAAAGAMLGFLDHRIDLDPVLRPLVIVGFLGGLTTFSSFSLEVVQALQGQRPLLACTIVLVHVTGSLVAALAGLLGIRALLA
jgi:fluoride exporter